MIARRHALVDKKSLDYNDIMANIYNNEPNFDYIASREDVVPEGNDHHAWYFFLSIVANDPIIV